MPKMKMRFSTTVLRKPEAPVTSDPGMFHRTCRMRSKGLVRAAISEQCERPVDGSLSPRAGAAGYICMNRLYTRDFPRLISCSYQLASNQIFWDVPIVADAHRQQCSRQTYRIDGKEGTPPVLVIAAPFEYRRANEDVHKAESKQQSHSELEVRRCPGSQASTPPLYLATLQQREYQLPCS